jgi:TrmH family RNA methyltransferase
MQITSRQNPKIKQTRALQSRKTRQESGLFVVEGIRHVGEAIQTNYPIEYIIFAPEILRSEFADEMMEIANKRGIPTFETDADIFNTLAEKAGPQGIIAVARQRATPLKSLTPTTHSWLVAALAPQDPGNLGTIIRTIDAVGADGLILLEGGVDPWHPTAVRASMGACFRIPIAITDWGEFVIWANGIHIYGTSSHGTSSYREVVYDQPCILLLGSERQGLTQEQVEKCEVLVRIPMEGHASSLNLAIATGVLLYEMHDQLRKSR